MKTTLFLLCCTMLSGVVHGSSIANLTPIYSKDKTTYTGTNGDRLAINNNTVLVDNSSSTKNNWTLAFTLSGLQETNADKVATVFTYDTQKPFSNLEGFGYQLTKNDLGTFDLTLCVGGYNYNGGTANSSPWKKTVITNYSTDSNLTLFYSYSDGSISINMAVTTGETTTIQNLTTLAGSAAFSGQYMTGINFSEKNSTGDTWDLPNYSAGKFTLEQFDLYNVNLTPEQMVAYSIPEPSAAILGIVGLGLSLSRRRRTQ